MGCVVRIISILLVTLKLFVCAKKPNFVLFVADDLGYGDLQAYGDPVSDTPTIDILFRDGLKLTQLYSASPVCTPARAGLLTGRYPVRSGFWNTQDALACFSLNSLSGLPLNETTIAELVADKGYKSALVGKWHLGVGRDREFLPRHQGFDHFFGLPVSHEQCENTICFAPEVPCAPRFSLTAVGVPPCPLFFEDEIIEQPVNLVRLAERQAFAARSWIKEFSEEGFPFLLMYWFVHPHVPHFASPKFHNSTLGGPFTDSLAELDWQIQQVITELKEIGEFDNTLFLFTSDNGPDKTAGIASGSSGPLRCGKGSTYEGGTRVPGVVYWPSRIPAGISTQFITHLDIWPTIASIIGSSAENYDIKLDGYDISDVFFNNGESTRSSFMYFNTTPHPDEGSFAFRYNQYKAHFMTLAPLFCSNPDDYDIMCRGILPYTRYDPPLVHNLLLDPEERVNLAENGGLESLLDEIQAAKLLEESGLTYGDSVLHDYDDSIQACCNEGCEPFPACCRCVSNYTNALFSSPERDRNMPRSGLIILMVLVVVVIISCVISCVIIYSIGLKSKRQVDEYINID